MRLSLIMFVIGVLFVVKGYTLQLDPKCNEKPLVKVVPRTVYDEIVKNSSMNVTPN